MKTGVAYSGNRLLKHVREDMRDCIEHNCTYVLHMLSENDMARHNEVLKDIVKITHDFGLEVWLDSWGMGRAFAGDISSFCGEYPEDRQVMSNGKIVPRACIYAPEFRNFIRKWADMAAEIGADVAFWDEPNLASEYCGTELIWGCRCERCQNLFKEKYGGEMPLEMTPEVVDFRHESIVDFLDFATRCGHEKGMKNAICCMIGKSNRFGDKNWDDIVSLPAVDNFGTDPYCHWVEDKVSVADYYGKYTRQLIEICNRFGKDHHVWVQAYGIKAGAENEIIEAVAACAEAGAQNIAAWGYAGCEANNYRCENPEVAWEAVGEAFRRIRW